MSEKLANNITSSNMHRHKSKSHNSGGSNPREPKENKQLEKYVADNFPGDTYIDKHHLFSARETAIYIPLKCNMNSNKLNVILWIHGFYVHDAIDLINPKVKNFATNLRESVHDSESNVVLIAPWLGYKARIDGKIVGELGLGKLGQGHGLKIYLEEILNALAHLNGKGDGYYQIDRLIIAGHSAGGGMMMEAVKTLGDLRQILIECWGFDCIYQSAEVWSSWMRGLQKKTPVRIIIYIANGSIPGYAVDLIKKINGTLKKPAHNHGQSKTIGLMKKMIVVQAFNVYGTLIDRIAFQVAEEIQKKPSGDDYEKLRMQYDPLLDSKTNKEYWHEIHKKLKGHFQVVQELMTPRIKDALNPK